jgi:hypothetical protein
LIKDFDGPAQVVKPLAILFPGQVLSGKEKIGAAPVNQKQKQNEKQ